MKGSERRPGAIRRRVSFVVVLALAVAGSIGIGAALADTSNGTAISACYQKNNGQLRVLQGAQTCSAAETAIAWNQSGPQGLPGPKGDPGAKGDKGDPGTGLKKLDDLKGIPCTAPNGDGKVGLSFSAQNEVSLTCDPSGFKLTVWSNAAQGSPPNCYTDQNGNYGCHGGYASGNGQVTVTYGTTTLTCGSSIFGHECDFYITPGTTITVTAFGTNFPSQTQTITMTADQTVTYIFPNVGPQYAG